MLDQYIAQWKSKAQALGGRSFRGFAPKRVEYGGSLSMMGSEEENLRQPQDGAQDVSRVTEIRPHLKGTLVDEPEDARLTGGTRSLMRRVMGLNVTAAVKTPPVVQVAMSKSGPARLAVVGKRIQVA